MNDTNPTTTPNLSPARPQDTVEPHVATAGDVEASELARHGDPSQAKTVASATAPGEATGRGGRGVVWVRPSELMGQSTAWIAGRGIDFQAELVRRARRTAVQPVAASRRAIGERARRLPPVTAFGRRGQAQQGATRAGIGLR